MLTIYVVDITTRVLVDASPSESEQIISLSVGERFGRAGFHTAGEESFYDPGITEGTLSNPGGQGLVVFVGRDLEGAGNHAVATADADRLVIGHGTGFGLFEGAHETSRGAGRLQTVIALDFSV